MLYTETVLFGCVVPADCHLLVQCYWSLIRGAFTHTCCPAFSTPFSFIMLCQAYFLLLRPTFSSTNVLLTVLNIRILPISQKPANFLLLSPSPTGLLALSSFSSRSSCSLFFLHETFLPHLLFLWAFFLLLLSPTTVVFLLILLSPQGLLARFSSSIGTLVLFSFSDILLALSSFFNEASLYVCLLHQDLLLSCSFFFLKQAFFLLYSTSSLSKMSCFSFL